MGIKKSAVFFVMMVMLAGCGSGVDQNKPLDIIRQEIEGMSVSQLQSKAQAYANVLVSKKAELEKIHQALNGLSPAQLLGEETKRIRENLNKVGTDVKALTERYNLYVAKFKELGGN